MARAGVTEEAQPARSKSQLAYAWIRDRIASREFTPGHRLVLATLAEQLDMSVVPVREAIRQLEAEGLVTFQRNVGAQVAMIDDAQYRQSMEALAILEGAATALAARHLSVEDLRLARSLNDRLVDSLDHFDPPSFTALNQQFHEVLHAPCPNPRLSDLVTAEWARLDHLRVSTFSYVPGRARESVREHEDIMRLIETGAPLPEIEDCARRHRSATLTAYLSHEHPDDFPPLHDAH